MTVLIIQMEMMNTTNFKLTRKINNKINEAVDLNIIAIVNYKAIING